MLKLGFNSSFIEIGKEAIRLSPSLTLSFCCVYKKKENKMFSGSFCPVEMGLGNMCMGKSPVNENIEYNEENKKEEIHGFFSKKSYFRFFLNISYLHYENGNGFFIMGEVWFVISENSSGDYCC
jgi:hypothetical protein